jgi:biopolymer transport protein ExbD
MARRTAFVSLEQIKEINLTPLIDLTFLLLITFIITFPMIEQGIPVNLPRGRAEDIDERRTRTITIDRKGAIYLDQQPIDPAALTAQMKTLGASDPDATVLVRGDEQLVYGRIVEVMRILHEAKIARMALVTQGDERP